MNLNRFSSVAQSCRLIYGLKRGQNEYCSFSSNVVVTLFHHRTHLKEKNQVDHVMEKLPTFSKEWCPSFKFLVIKQNLIQFFPIFLVFCVLFLARRFLSYTYLSSLAISTQRRIDSLVDKDGFSLRQNFLSSGIFIIIENIYFFNGNFAFLAKIVEKILLAIIVNLPWIEKIWNPRSKAESNKRKLYNKNEQVELNFKQFDKVYFHLFLS